MLKSSAMSNFDLPQSIIGCEIGSRVIASRIYAKILSMAAGQAVRGRRSATICIMLSRNHIDLKLSAKKIVRTIFAATAPFAASSIES